MPNTLPSKPPASPKPPLPRAPAHLPAFADDMLPLSPGHTHVSVLWEGSSRSSSLPGQQQGSFDSAGGCLPRTCCELANKEHCQKALPAKKTPAPNTLYHYCTCCREQRRAAAISSHGFCSFKLKKANLWKNLSKGDTGRSSASPGSWGDWLGDPQEEFPRLSEHCQG